MAKYQYALHTNGDTTIPLTELPRYIYEGLINILIESGVKLCDVTIDEDEDGRTYKVTKFEKEGDEGNINEAYFVAIYEKGEEIV